jgi:hypothetical protein
MASMKLSEEPDDVFRVAFGPGPRGSLLRPFGSRPVRLDPFAIGQAFRAVMARAEARSVTGARLLWNLWRIFLSHDDLDRLRPLEDRLKADLGVIFDEELKRAAAQTPGRLRVELLADEGGEVEQGNILFRPGFELSSGEPSRRPGRPASTTDATQRVGLPPLPVAEDRPTPSPSETFRIAEPPTARLQLTWAGGGALVPLGRRVVFGRPHEAPGGLFVALNGASGRISRRHLWIEDDGQSALVGRFPDANPVQVQGRLVQPGGSMAVESFPIEIALSNGEMVLVLEEATF